ncbi:MAG: DEAD/DEAH box helicase family protein [Desulfoplanes sp.]|nr:DEAD/DEAH box helicase family protein [Desulfoplanes sp.]
MKLQFDSELDYQLEAIKAVTDFFEGLPRRQGSFDLVFPGSKGQLPLLNSKGTVNTLDLSMFQPRMLKNLHTIQERNVIPVSSRLVEPDDEYGFPNFSVEMETGTGKTYVYLRTLLELHEMYGFKKFIIVVPSVAIREGVTTSIRLMRDHFKGLYNNVAFDDFVYSSKELSKVRQFALNNEIQIMVINIQAFLKKETNIIHQAQDKMSGDKPIDFIRRVKPILIIDEPQSVDTTPKARKAINSLNPLFCLRYSATHIKPYNTVYKLGPITAYDKRLVKQIEVDSIFAEDNFNQVFIRLDKIGYAKGAKTPHAKAAIHEDTQSGTKEKKITLKQGTDISQQTSRSGYDGYIVTNISAEDGFEHVEFANGKILELHQEEGSMNDEKLKQQIYQTVEEHFKKEKRFKNRNLKVLSLFFVDKVANYRWYDDEGKAQKGKIARWFEEAFLEISQQPRFQGVIPYSVDDVHDGYFSADKKKGRVVLKDTKGTTKADEETYELIMRDKERLLSLDEPLRFIFSHSALREGWDNPNVFQICSLREMGTERERRQILGRGLRLPVNGDGIRVFDESVNKLTVVANETFSQYAKGLQEEIEKDVGGGFKFGRVERIAFARILDVKTDEPIGQDSSRTIWNALVKSGYLKPEGDITEKFVPEEEGFVLELPDEFEPYASSIIDEMKRFIFKNRVVNKRDRRLLTYNKRVELNDDFSILWEKINKKTKYCVEFKTEELILKTVEKIRAMEPIRPVRILIDKTEVAINEAGVEGGRVLETKTVFTPTPEVLPDILSFLQRETELTRSTLFDILKQSGRLEEFAVNPQAFMTQVSGLIRRSLHEMIVDGIKYERLEGQEYEMRRFEEVEIEEYLSRLYHITSKDDRTPYDYVPFDSDVERKVAERLDESENVKFFCKLPRWFVIPTPLGNYNPDWAVVTEGDAHLYLVRETKSTHDAGKRRDSENRKIACGRAHFNALGVNFKVATGIHEVLEG